MVARWSRWPWLSLCWNVYVIALFPDIAWKSFILYSPTASDNTPWNIPCSVWFSLAEWLYTTEVCFSYWTQGGGRATSGALCKCRRTRQGNCDATIVTAWVTFIGSSLCLSYAGYSLCKEVCWCVCMHNLKSIYLCLKHHHVITHFLIVKWLTSCTGICICHTVLLLDGLTCVRVQILYLSIGQARLQGIWQSMQIILAMISSDLNLQSNIYTQSAS